MTSTDSAMRQALQLVAPGTDLREGLKRIQRSHTGALIVLGDTPQVESICSGGFPIDIPFSASRLRELTKMDGAVIIDVESGRIKRANVQLLPDHSIETTETGMRHRTAQRTAKQTGVPVLSVSASMRLISVYVGDEHHTVEEPDVLLSRANQAVNTLERYTERLAEVLTSLSIFELRNSATIRDVTTVVQLMEMIRRITGEINGYLDELGDEGRLLSLQLDDLLRESTSERHLLVHDYMPQSASVEEIENQLALLSAESLLELPKVAQVLGAIVYEQSDLDEIIRPRGVRSLAAIPKLPWRIIRDVTDRWPSLDQLQTLTVEDLQEVEGVGPYRAKQIVDHLDRAATLSH